MMINNRPLNMSSAFRTDHIISNVNQEGHGEIYFKSKELRRAILSSLGHNANDVAITPSIMETITHIDASGLGIHDVYPLKYCKNLEVLDLSNNSIQDVSSLSYCSKLKELLVPNNKIETLSPVESMKRLSILDAGNNLICSVTSISACSSLKLLFLNSNRIKSFDVLAKLKTLRVLDLSSNMIQKAHGLSDFSQLRMLCLNDNPIDDTCAIEDSLAIQYLWIYDSHIHKNKFYINIDGHRLCLY